MSLDPLAVNTPEQHGRADSAALLISPQTATPPDGNVNVNADVPMPRPPLLKRVTSAPVSGAPQSAPRRYPTVVLTKTQPLPKLSMAGIAEHELKQRPETAPVVTQRAHRRTPSGSAIASEADANDAASAVAGAGALRRLRGRMPLLPASRGHASMRDLHAAVDEAPQQMLHIRVEGVNDSVPRPVRSRAHNRSASMLSLTGGSPSHRRPGSNLSQDQIQLTLTSDNDIAAAGAGAGTAESQGAWVTQKHSPSRGKHTRQMSTPSGHQILPLAVPQGKIRSVSESPAEPKAAVAVAVTAADKKQTPESKDKDKDKDSAPNSRSGTLRRPHKRALSKLISIDRWFSSPADRLDKDAQNEAEQALLQPPDLRPT